MAKMPQEETNLIHQEIIGMLTKGAILVARNLEGQFLSQIILVGKSSSDQSERIEQSDLQCTLQDEMSISVERIAAARGLYVQD